MLTHSRMWYLIDAKSKRPGRLASQIGSILQGKRKPIHSALQDCGDHVVVINADRVEFSGAKWDKKLYRRHTGFPGGFREVQAKHLHEKKPLEVLRKATFGMLPRNRLRPAWMDRLHLIEGEEHPYGENITTVLESKGRGKEQGFDLADMVLRPPGDLHLLEQYLEGQELEVVANIKAETDE